MSELNHLAPLRASHYRWFSQLLFQELTENSFRGLTGNDIRHFLSGLKTIPSLQIASQQFQKKLRAARRRPDYVLELAADYASLFLTAPPYGISPYAGHYPHSASAEERRVMNLWLKQIQCRSANNEASDHLAIQLAVMAALIESNAPDALAKQQNFLQHHLLSWLPLLTKRSQELDRFGFYSSLIYLLKAYVEQDINYLAFSHAETQIAQS